MSRIARDLSAWTDTPKGAEAYRAAKALALRLADADGFDRGIERNDIFQSFAVFILPRRENRNGHELRCEVVSCTDMGRMQSGHGWKS